MAKAQAEYKEKTATGLSLRHATVAPKASSTKVYNINGSPAKENTRGIVIQNGKKMAVGN